MALIVFRYFGAVFVFTKDEADVGADGLFPFSLSGIETVSTTAAVVVGAATTARVFVSTIPANER